MSERVVVVTGASSGIGRALAAGLARDGARVGLVCRDPRRGGETVAELEALGGGGAVDLFLADLASQKEIRRLADELLERYPRIQVLVNNAGVIEARRTTTVDGLETVFAVNHLAYYLLTRLLLERLAASAPARIVNVASGAHRGARLDWDDLQNERGYSAFRVYGESKLANLLFTYELARRLEGTGVTANAVHPGWVGTRFGTHNGTVGLLMGVAGRLLARSPEKGAETPLYLARSPDVAGVSGRYFFDCREAASSPASHEREAQARLWEESARLTGLDP